MKQLPGQLGVSASLMSMRKANRYVAVIHSTVINVCTTVHTKHTIRLYTY